MFHPDVIVRANDRPEVRLVVEVKTGKVNLDKAARQLQEYMKGEACPLGLLVTPQETHVYRETYLDTPDSIHELAVVQTPALIKSRGVIENGPELEMAVRRWLETMVQHPGIPLHHEGEPARIEDHLMPAMVGAEVTVVGPR